MFAAIFLFAGLADAALAQIQPGPVLDARVQGGPALVGDLGDVRKLVFDGVKSFSADSIRHTMRMNPDFLLAAHPAAPLDEYIQTIQRMVRVGYQEAGFPDARVNAVVDPPLRVKVSVAEGPRYRAGAVKVSGAKRVPTEALVRRFTEQYPPREALAVIGPRPAAAPAGEGTLARFKAGLDMSPAVFDRTGKPVQPTPPVWRKDEPVRFDQSSLEAIYSTLTNGLADLGFLFPQVDVDILRDKNSGTADLAIAIADEGPMDVVHEIEVSGSSKNSRLEILRYLQIEPGMNINRTALTKLDLALWRSARFLDHNIAVTRRQDDPCKLTLKIALREYEPAPPLAKNLSPEEKVLLKFCEWMSSFSSRDEDLAGSASGRLFESWPELQARFIISGKLGWMLSVEEPGSGKATSWQTTWMGTTGKLGWSSRARSRRIVVTSKSQQPWAHLQFVPSPDPSAAEKMHIEFGAGIRAAERDLSSNGMSGFQLETVLAPVAFLDIVHRPNQRVSLTPGVLSVTNHAVSLRIDAEFGRLLSFDLHGSTNGQMTIRAAPGLFRKAMQQFDSETAAQPNCFDSRKPCSSLAGFLLGEALETPVLAAFVFRDVSLEKRERASRAFAKFFQADILGPLDDWMAHLPEDFASDFDIPRAGGDSQSQPANQLMVTLATWAFRSCDELFPKAAWPWTVAHETVFVLAGKPKYTDLELKRLYESNETGPIGFLSIARLLSMIHTPAAGNFAREGLARLFTDDFRKDYRLLLESDSPLSKSILRAAAALRNLDENDLTAMADVLPGHSGELLRNAARMLRDENGRPADALARALDLYWDQSLRKQVQAAFIQVLRSQSDPVLRK